MRRSWKSRLLELAVWAAVSIATALILILVADSVLAPNF